MAENQRRRRRTNRQPAAPAAPAAVPSVPEFAPASAAAPSSPVNVSQTAPVEPHVTIVPPAPVKTMAAAAPELTQDEIDRAYLLAAEERARVIAENDDGSLDTADQFKFDQSIVPPGWDYQWKTKTVMGAEDPGYKVQLQKAGWTPVPARRHPEMMPVGYTGDTIERKGQILMEMPKSVVDRRRIMDKNAALDQVRIKERQLSSAPPGTFERVNKDNPLSTVKRNYAPLVVPDSAA